VSVVVGDMQCRLFGGGGGGVTDSGLENFGKGEWMWIRSCLLCHQLNVCLLPSECVATCHAASPPHPFHPAHCACHHHHNSHSHSNIVTTTITPHCDC